MNTANRKVLPGFGLSLGYTLTYLSLLVLIPLAALVLKAAALSPQRFWETLWNERTLSAFGLTFGAAFVSAVVNGFIGMLLAWVLVRYDFWGKRFFDALVDLPLALPTAVAGLVYSQLYLKNGWFGRVLVPLGIEGSNSRLGIVLVLVFTGLPFVVRSIQPVLESIEPEVEEAASSLGASRWQIFRRVLFPAVLPALLTGFALSLARSLGEYGSVIFIAGNIRNKTEIAPVVIAERVEEVTYNSNAYNEAAALALVLLISSLVLLLLINRMERWSQRYAGLA